ncbi:hypothetical protein K2Q16_02680 [Patescibacteria group bacterium]|nr:hypothetical protein [Patescibacteria group bacterium]
MEKRTILLFVALFVIIVAGMFTFAYLKRTEVATPPSLQVDAASSSLPYVTRIDAKHYYIDGVHTLVGVIDMPTPCDLLTTESRVMESMPEQVVFDFSVINNAESCVQVVTAQRFKVSARAAKDARMSATWQGQPVELNLIPAMPGEVPEDFELFIKG